MSLLKRSSPTGPAILRVSLEAEDRILVRLDGPVGNLPSIDRFSLSHGATLHRILRAGPQSMFLVGDPFDERTYYQLTDLLNGENWPVLPDGILDRYLPRKPLGLVRESDGYRFRFFAPRVEETFLEFRHQPDEEPFSELSLTLDPDTGCWEGTSEALHPGDLVCYRVKGAPGGAEIDSLGFADPWSWAIVKRDDWRRRSMSLILPDELLVLPAAEHVWFEGRQRVIYEAHLKDVTILHPGVNTENRGTYLGAVEGDDAPGCFHHHLAQLGVNTVEWLPLADYDYHEPPFGQRVPGHHNTWNRYAINHWGYMPAYWFAPEARYAGDTDPSGWIGRSGNQVRHLREMIRRQHAMGFSVIVDVVYNHVAQYGENPMRQIDPHYSLRHDGKGKQTSASGCGNDLATERPVIRKLIVESLRHWIRYYGVDGFRFDLAGVLDDGTLDAISRELRKEFPKICLIAEPWGGIYDKSRFAVRGWSSWNDLYRDGIRGFDPKNDPGALFGRKLESLIRHLTGNLTQDSGPFQKEEYGVNYLACHDGFTLADFLRIALAEEDRKFSPEQEFPPLSHKLLSRLKLAFLLLFSTRGMIMWHQGEEFGHSKRISRDQISDTSACKLDHDSYNKDNPTNWLDWTFLQESTRRDLLDYVAGLGAIRQKHPALSYARRENVHEIRGSHTQAIGLELTTGIDHIVLLVNLSDRLEAVFRLPSERWIALADNERANSEAPVTGVFKDKATLSELSGMLLVPVE